VLLINKDTKKISQAFEAATIHNHTSFKCAIITLDDDDDSLEVGVYIATKLHVPKIIANIKNATWAHHFGSAGIVPLFGISTEAQAIYQTMSASSNSISLAVPPSKKSSLIQTCESIIKPQDNIFIQAFLDQQQSEEHAKWFPNASHILDSVVGTSGKFNLKASIPVSLQQDVQNLMHEAHSGSISQISDEDMRQMSDQFLTPIMHLNNRDVAEEKKKLTASIRNQHRDNDDI